jgi:hypothetical protein
VIEPALFYFHLLNVTGTFLGLGTKNYADLKQYFSKDKA